MEAHVLQGNAIIRPLVMKPEDKLGMWYSISFRNPRPLQTKYTSCKVPTSALTSGNRAGLDAGVKGLQSMLVIGQPTSWPFRSWSGSPNTVQGQGSSAAPSVPRDWRHVSPDYFLASRAYYVGMTNA
ncbi:hypothetical protein HYE67_003812 [Fusarium culmorum]|uniref:Uncharacterized protein n=1 Tax=Fusarium culmorum TaxID=5516 RepID=A0A2T4GK53_FUSCU|nr:hypothetical protein FCULG_00000978 [Fusarium culmorum]QPC61581.1 hypothetical protein HYE67_003812 [Fusarium culmorum]